MFKNKRLSKYSQYVTTFYSQNWFTLVSFLFKGEHTGLYIPFLIWRCENFMQENYILIKVIKCRPEIAWRSIRAGLPTFFRDILIYFLFFESYCNMCINWSCAIKILSGMQIIKRHVNVILLAISSLHVTKNVYKQIIFLKELKKLDFSLKCLILLAK